MTGAERARRHRDRQRRGREIWEVEVDPHALAETLIELGLVDPNTADDAGYEAAAGVLLDDFATKSVTRYSVWLARHGKLDP